MENLKLISMRETENRTTFSRTAINKLRKKNQFPKPVQIGEKRLAFVAAEVDQWIADRIAARDEVSV